MRYFGTIEQSTYAFVKSSYLFAGLTATMFLVAGTFPAPILNPNPASQAAPPPSDAPQLQVALWLTIFNRGVSISGPDLTSKQIQVFEDGRQQSNVGLIRENTGPLAVGLLMQASRERRNTLPHAEIEPATTFFHLLPDGSVGFAETFSDHIEIVSRPTTDPAEMERNLRKSANFDLKGCSALFDAIVSATENFTPYPERPRALLVISDGHDNCSKKTAEDALEAAQRVQARIYFINLALVDLTDSAPGHNRGRPARIFRLEQLAKQLAEPTGGTAVDLLGPEGFASLFDQIRMQLEIRFRLRYNSSNPIHDGKFRSVRIDVGRNYAEILAPSGYYAPKD